MNLTLEQLKNECVINNGQVKFSNVNGEKLAFTLGVRRNCASSLHNLLSVQILSCVSNRQGGWNIRSGWKNLKEQ